MVKEPIYSIEPSNKRNFTKDFDKFYTKFANIYKLSVEYFPIWKSWIKRALPYISGPHVLEVSFGTGYLLLRYADKFDTHGIDYNKRMVALTKKISCRGVLQLIFKWEMLSICTMKMNI